MLAFRFANGSSEVFNERIYELEPKLLDEDQIIELRNKEAIENQKIWEDNIEGLKVLFETKINRKE